MWPEIVAALPAFRGRGLRLVVTYGWEGLRTWDSVAGLAGTLRPGGSGGQRALRRLRCDLYGPAEQT